MTLSRLSRQVVLFSRSLSGVVQSRAVTAATTSWMAARSGSAMVASQRSLLCLLK